MELDHLKKVWQKTSGEMGKGYFISEDSLRELIKKKSNTAIAKVKRQMKQKAMFAGVISLLLFVIAAFIFNTSESLYNNIPNVEAGIFYIVFGSVIAFISLLNVYSYNKVNRIKEYKSDLKHSISSVIKILHKAIKAKIISDILVLPITITVLSMVSFIRGFGAFSDPKFVLYSMLIALGFGVIAYFISRKTQQKRYGRQLKTLEDSLAELDTEK